MHRFYLDEGREDTLLPEDARHALTVLRMKSGDPLEVFAGEKRYLAEILDVSGETVRVRRLSLLPSTEPRLRITLFQGLPKAEKMEWIIQKAVELGVDQVVPVLMRRCVVQWKPSDGARKLERWSRISREACKQSGRCRIPEISSPVPLKNLPPLLSSLSACAVPWEEADGMGPSAFARMHPGLTSLGIVIGPEGGIDPEEMEALSREGCAAITLGPRILRTETAGLATISAFMALYGEMEGEP